MFSNEARYPTGEFPLYIATGDFDGDRRLDLAVTNFDSKDVSILLGRGDGTFVGERRLPVGTQPSGIVTADFGGAKDSRGNPILDLAITDTGSGTVALLLGNGDGTFQGPVDYTVGNVPYTVVTGDFDGDGRFDLATANRQSTDVSVLLGRGD